MDVRLTEFQIKSIRDCFVRYFTPNDELWVFGSRANMNAKGGDIDLYIETKLPDITAYETTKKFLQTLKEKIGDQKIDVVLKRSDFYLPIYDIAKKEGVQIIMNKNIVLLRGEIQICDKHAMRMYNALKHIRNLSPLTVEKLDSLEDLELGYLEILTNRFGKLQDAIAQKIFPAFLSLLGEDIDQKSFIDRLNLLEKLSIIPNVEFWNDIRAIRNALTHEYPDKPELLIYGINDCINKSQSLLNYWEQLKERMKEAGV